MVYRDALRHSCKRCGKLRNPDERFSVRGRCQACGEEPMVANANQLREHRGEFFDHWRKRCLAAFGVTE